MFRTMRRLAARIWGWFQRTAGHAPDCATSVALPVTSAGAPDGSVKIQLGPSKTLELEPMASRATAGENPLDWAEVTARPHIFGQGYICRYLQPSLSHGTVFVITVFFDGRVDIRRPEQADRHLLRAVEVQ